MQQLSLQQMEKCGSHVVSGGSQQQPSQSLPPIKETVDDNPASDDMEDEDYYVQEASCAAAETEEIEERYRKKLKKEMKHPPSGGDHACSVMAQCGSDCDDWWDREPEDHRLRYLVGPYMTPPDFERLSWWDDQDPEGGDFMGMEDGDGKYATWTYQQVKDVDDAYCAWAMEACDTTSSLGFRRFVSWLNSATAAPAVVEAVLPRPSRSSSASATAPATPAAATADVEHPERLRQQWWLCESGLWWTRRDDNDDWHLAGRLSWGGLGY